MVGTHHMSCTQSHGLIQQTEWRKRIGVFWCVTQKYVRVGSGKGKRIFTIQI